MELENFHGPLIRPGNKVPKEFTVAGTATIKQRRIYTLAMRWNKMAVETIHAAINETRHAEQNEAIAAAAKLHNQSQAMMYVLMMSVREELGLWDKSFVVVARNWKVAWHSQEVPEGVSLKERLLHDCM